MNNMPKSNLISRGNTKRIEARENANIFLDKEKLKEWIAEYKEKVEKAKAEGKEPPIVPNKIGKAFMDIANSLSRRPNFIGYSYVDEMVSFAVFTCLKALKNFDVNAGTSAFAYFVQICNYAFLTVLKKEKEQRMIRGATLEQLRISGDLEFQDNPNFQKQYEEIMAVYCKDISTEKPKEKPIKVEKNLLEDFE